MLVFVMMILILFFFVYCVVVVVEGIYDNDMLYVCFFVGLSNIWQ